MKKLKYILFCVLIILVLFFIIKYNSIIDGLETQSKFMTIIKAGCSFICSPEKFQTRMVAISAMPGMMDGLYSSYRNNDINNLANLLNTPPMLNILNENSTNCSQENIQTTVNEISEIPGMMDSINLSIQNNNVQQFVNLVNTPSIFSIFNKNIPNCRFPEMVTEIAAAKGIKPTLSPTTPIPSTTLSPTIPSIPLHKYFLNTSYGPICLDGNNNNISMKPCNNSTSQQWYNHNTNYNYKVLMNNYTHNCLDVKNNKLITNNCNNSSTQKWKYPPKNKTFNNLFMPETCLDGTGGNLTMKKCDSNSNQQWLTNSM